MSAISKRLDKLELQTAGDSMDMILVVLEKDESTEQALVRCGHDADTPSDRLMFVSFVDPEDVAG